MPIQQPEMDRNGPSSCSSCPDQAIEQCPRQNEASQASKQAARPEIKGATEVSARVERALARCQRCRCDAERVEEAGNDDGEDDVEEEAAVRLEAQDAGGDAEEGGGQTLKV